MKSNEFVDINNRIVRLRMKALRIGLADNMYSYILAFN